MHEGQPFVPQLRLVALGHSCPKRAVAAEPSQTARHLHLVNNAQEAILPGR